MSVGSDGRGFERGGVSAGAAERLGGGSGSGSVGGRGRAVVGTLAVMGLGMAQAAWGAGPAFEVVGEGSAAVAGAWAVPATVATHDAEPAAAAAHGAGLTVGGGESTAAEGQAVSLAAREYRIAAGPLGEALRAFEQQSGLRLRLTVKKDALAGFESRGLEGRYEPKEALRLLLDGTGLTSSVEEQGAAVGLSRSDETTVTAEIPNSVAMTKFTEPLIDTPQTVAVVPQFVLQEEQNTTLRDALRNVPGISMAAGEFGAQGDNLTIRGFTARNDIYLDGIRDFGSYYRDSFDYEQVEVLEGPAGVQFGRGSTGGIINQESKTPAAARFLNAETLFGTNGTTRLAVDGNLPLPQMGAGTALRLNAVATQGGVAGRPYAANRHYGLAPSLEFGMGGPTRATISYFHLTENDVPDYGLPWFYNRLSAASRYSYFGFPDQNYLRASVDAVTVRLEHDFSPAVTIHSLGRFANYGRNAQITEPQICSNASYATPVGGWVSALPTSAVSGGGLCPSLSANPATIRVNRNELQVKSVEGDLWDQTELTARFKLHGIANNFAGGVEGGKEVSDPIRTSYVAGSVTPTTLLNPNPHDAFGGQGYVSTVTHTTSRSVGLYFVDTLKLGRYFEASGGVRWDYFDTLYGVYGPQNAVGVVPSAAVGPLEQIVHQPSYRAALVYKPTGHGSVYFDWGTSFNPSAESLSLSVATSVLPPEQNETYEAGAKYSFLRDRLMVDGAWFRTTKLNARETSPTNSTVIVLAGNQRVEGVQASAVGRLVGGTDLVLGYAYLHSQVLSSQFFPTSVGYQLANVPTQTFNAFLSHNFWGFRGGFGGNYVASRTASSTVPFMPLSYGPATAFRSGTAPCGSAATQCYQVLQTGLKQVPGYWVFNAMVSHPVTEHLDVQANVYNLLNRFYIDQPHPSHLIPGEGVNALVGANWRF